MRKLLISGVESLWKQLEQVQFSYVQNVYKSVFIHNGKEQLGTYTLAARSLYSGLINKKFQVLTPYLLSLSPFSTKPTKTTYINKGVLL